MSPALRLVEQPGPQTVPRPLPERRAVVRFKSGHVLKIDHGHVAHVLRVKAILDSCDMSAPTPEGERP